MVEIRVASFTVDDARALPGPAWLRERRGEAAERAIAAPMPTIEEEIWRYSRIAELDLSRLSPDATALVTTISSSDGAVVLGVDDDTTAAAASALGSVMGPAPDRFAELNNAFGAAPIVITVAPGRSVREPIMVEHHIGREGVAVFPRLVVDAGDDSEIVVVERFRSDDVFALVCPVVEIRAAQSARVRYVGINQLGPRVWMIGHQIARADRDSTTMLASVGLGGDYARVRTDARLDGQGASGEQIALYFGEAGQMHDFRTLQEHVAPKTTSNLLFKGAVEGASRSVYTGLIKIGKDARGSNAFQTNRNITLSEGAWAESVPNLDIETNDVRCSHASTVGPIDEDQRFYIESRGVAPAVAERLIVLGFFDEILGRLPVPSLIPELRAEVAAKLDRRTDIVVAERVDA